MATPSLLPRRLSMLPLRSRMAAPSLTFRRFIDTDARGIPESPPKTTAATTAEEEPAVESPPAGTQSLQSLSMTFGILSKPGLVNRRRVEQSGKPTSSFLSAGNHTTEAYKLHIYSHKHNTHITLAKPDRDCVISLSAGNIGFKKANRGTYDAGYQLASHVFQKLEEKKIRPRNLEVVLRGFGNGREAAVKALLGSEGRNLRSAIRTVSDATRLKFGGTRSKKPRRLG